MILEIIKQEQSNYGSIKAGCFDGRSAGSPSSGGSGSGGGSDSLGSSKF